jgi:hypothetical protein
VHLRPLGGHISKALRINPPNTTPVLFASYHIPIVRRIVLPPASCNGDRIPAVVGRAPRISSESPAPVPSILWGRAPVTLPRIAPGTGDIIGISHGDTGNGFMFPLAFKRGGVRTTGTTFPRDDCLNTRVRLGRDLLTGDTIGAPIPSWVAAVSNKACTVSVASLCVHPLGLARNNVAVVEVCGCKGGDCNRIPMPGAFTGCSSSMGYSLLRKILRTGSGDPYPGDCGDVIEMVKGVFPVVGRT